MPKKTKTKNKGSVPTEYAEVKVDHGIFEDYLQYGPQYDTVNDCPVIAGETEFVPRQRLGKLSKSMRNVLREYMSHAAHCLPFPAKNLFSRLPYRFRLPLPKINTVSCRSVQNNLTGPYRQIPRSVR